MTATTELKKIPENASKSVLNRGKGECTSVSKWKEITLKEFDFGIFQYFSIQFLQHQSRYFSDTSRISFSFFAQNQ